ncbi:Crossover junction endodeoxyribonuclease RuvC [compost metagenome]
MTHFVGIDPSGNTGLTVITDNETILAREVVLKMPLSATYSEIFKYCEQILSHLPVNSIVCIENVSHLSKGQAVHFQHVLAGFLRYLLELNKYTYYNVSPSQLKKFVTGNHNAKKSEMLKGVYRKWDFDTDSDNVADAYGLAKIAEAIQSESLELTKYELEVVQKIKEAV